MMKRQWMGISFAIVFAFALAACGSANTNETDSKDNNEAANENMEQEETASLPEAPLEKKDEGEEVEALQQVLQEIDYPVEATGTFDDLTTWALTDIQLQQEDELTITGMYDDKTETFIQTVLDDEETIEPGKELDEPEQPDAYPDEVENPYDVLAIANKEHALPEDYEPEDLVTPDIPFPFDEDLPKKHLRQVAADAIEDLVEAGEEDGVSIWGQSGFRSYDRQVELFESYAEEHGEDEANTYSARPGESEHQTGLVMDVTSEDIDFDINEDFADTEEGKWLKDHAHEFGFIIRYPEEKEDITQYQYEPWHIRYVGKQAAETIYENEATLEEYFDVD
ncbi:MAG TPA: D-alanyl-D-alanine carboxypeptidase family protein [Pseudogracilibacillus sp.]|nr:D-alanyl-D-alanine carboxypeptidase family protein [Pseudogracilibacillus sp.]